MVLNSNHALFLSQSYNLEDIKLYIFSMFKRIASTHCAKHCLDRLKKQIYFSQNLSGQSFPSFPHLVEKTEV